jgi:hypothetical protein
MSTSRAIAQLVGPTLVIITVSETINLRIWAVNLAPVTYLNGLAFFVAGLAVVRAHNRWARTWPVLVTISGWGLLALGLFRMFAPEAQQLGEDATSYVVIAAICLFGLALSILGYAPATAQGAPNEPARIDSSTTA